MDAPCLRRLAAQAALSRHFPFYLISDCALDYTFDCFYLQFGHFSAGHSMAAIQCDVIVSVFSLSLSLSAY